MQAGGRHVHVRIDQRGHAVGVVRRQGGVERAGRRHSVLRGADGGRIVGDRLKRGPDCGQHCRGVRGRHLSSIAGSQRCQIEGALGQYARSCGARRRRRNGDAEACGGRRRGDSGGGGVGGGGGGGDCRGVAVGVEARISRHSRGAVERHGGDHEGIAGRHDAVSAVGRGNAIGAARVQRVQRVDRGLVRDVRPVCRGGDAWSRAARERLGLEVDRADGTAGRARVEARHEAHRRLLRRHDAAVEDIRAIEGSAVDRVGQLRRKRRERGVDIRNVGAGIGCLADRGLNRIDRRNDRVDRGRRRIENGLALGESGVRGGHDAAVGTQLLPDRPIGRVLGGVRDRQAAGNLVLGDRQVQFRHVQGLKR